jgi:hypothetical protein
MSKPTGIELLEGSIQRVWNEHDDTKRLKAIGELYHPNGTIFEPQRAISGHQQMSDVVRGVLLDMPPGFRFEVIGPSLEHHGIAITRWRGVVGNEVTVSGSDVLRYVDGLIVDHFFFFDPKP